MQAHLGLRAKLQVFDAKIRQFLDASARVVQRQQEGAITERQAAGRWQLIEECRDLVSVEKAGFGWRYPFARNACDLLCDGETFGHAPPEKLEERMEDHQPVVACPPVIVAAVFEMLEKPEDAIERQCVQCDLREPTRHIGGDEREKEPQRIAMGFDGGRPEALLERELVREEGVEQGAE
jgi:hypothetical protein